LFKWEIVARLIVVAISSSKSGASFPEAQAEENDLPEKGADQ
jgi:hypothetical protein